MVFNRQKTLATFGEAVFARVRYLPHPQVNDLLFQTGNVLRERTHQD